MMNLENYSKDLKTIDLAKANLIALQYLLFFALIFGLPFYIIWGFNLSGLFPENKVLKAILPLLVFVAGIVLHELIHGIFFAAFASKGIKAVKFGVLWKMLTPYCHCKEPLKVKHYIIALLAPLLVLGIIPGIVGVATGSFLLMIFGIVFSGAATGDIMIYNLINGEYQEDLVQDHPSEAGCYIFKKK